MNLSVDIASVFCLKLSCYTKFVVSAYIVLNKCPVVRTVCCAGYPQGMVDLMAESANEMLVSWEDIVDRGGGSAEVVVDEFLRNFSADVISRVAFGSRFSEGKEIFSKIRQLQVAMAKQDIFAALPGSRYAEREKKNFICLHIFCLFVG